MSINEITPTYTQAEVTIKWTSVKHEVLIIITDIQYS